MQPQRTEQLPGSEGFERLLLFTDAVFAIVMTVLIIDVKTPFEEHEKLNPETFFRMQGSLIDYFISFLLIGCLWSFHHRLFARYVRRYDRSLLWKNILMLICIGLIPFAAKFDSIYFYQLWYSDLVYASSLAAAILLLLLVWHHVAVRPDLVVEALDEKLIRRVTWKVIGGLFIILLIDAIFCYLNRTPPKHGIDFQYFDMSNFWVLLIAVVIRMDLRNYIGTNISSMRKSTIAFYALMICLSVVLSVAIYKIYLGFYHQNPEHEAKVTLYTNLVWDCITIVILCASILLPPLRTGKREPGIDVATHLEQENAELRGRVLALERQVDVEKEKAELRSQVLSLEGQLEAQVSQVTALALRLNAVEESSSPDGG